MVEFTKIGTPKVRFAFRPLWLCTCSSTPLSLALILCSMRILHAMCPLHASPMEAPDRGVGTNRQGRHTQVALSMRYVDQTTGRDTDVQHELLAKEPSLSTGGVPHATR